MLLSKGSTTQSKVSNVHGKAETGVCGYAKGAGACLCVCVCVCLFTLLSSACLLASQRARMPSLCVCVSVCVCVHHVPCCPLPVCPLQSLWRGTLCLDLTACSCCCSHLHTHTQTYTRARSIHTACTAYGSAAPTGRQAARTQGHKQAHRVCQDVELGPGSKNCHFSTRARKLVDAHVHITHIHTQKPTYLPRPFPS